MKNILCTLLLFLVATSTAPAQLPNANFEEWGMVDGTEQPLYWLTNNHPCCITVEKAEDPIEGMFSMKVSSNGFGIEGPSPGFAFTIFFPTQAYMGLTALVRIDSMDRGSARIEAYEWRTNNFYPIGLWITDTLTNGVDSITLLFDTIPSDSIRITVRAKNMATPNWSVGYGELVIDKIRLFPDLMSSSNTANEGSGLRVFPNPATDAITIEGQPGHGAMAFGLYNGLGQLVLEEAVPCCAPRHRIALGHLPGGIYYYSLRGQGKMDTGESGKLVVQR